MPGRTRGPAVTDGLRLALGTLTVLPTRPPTAIDRRVGSWAMTLAPLVGCLLAVVGGAFLWLLGLATLSPLLSAVLTVSLLALLTRAIHLDGLADTADGLGSRKPAAAALAIMRKSEVGPFGVVTLLLMLMIQVGALAQHLSEANGIVALGSALVISRALLPLVCSRGVPGARENGLGQVVAGTVTRSQLLLAVALTVLSLVVISVVISVVAPAVTPLGTSLGTSLAGPGASADVVSQLVRAGLGIVSAVLVGGGLCWRCVTRFGGTTGDVLGAVVEVSFTVVLLAYLLI